MAPRPGRALRRGTFAAALLIALPAGAQDTGWSVNGSLGQRFTGSTNIRLADDDGGDDGNFTFGTSTRLGLSLARAGPRSNFGLSTGFALSGFTGSQGSGLGGFSIPNFRFTYSYRARTWSLSTTASLSIQPASFATQELLFQPVDFDDGTGGGGLDPDDGGDPDDGTIDPDIDPDVDTGDGGGTGGVIDDPLPGAPLLETVNEDTLRIALGTATTLSLPIDTRNSFSIGSQIGLTRYLDETTLVPSTRVGGSLAWSHRITRNRSAGLSINISHIRIGNEENNRSLSLSLSGNYSQALTRDASLNLSLGLSQSRQTVDEDGGGRRVTTGTGLRGSASLRMPLNRLTNFSLGARQGLSAAADGTLRNTTALSMSLGHSINRRQSASLGVGLSRSSVFGGGGETRYALSVSPSLRYRLTDKISSSFGYGFRAGFDDGVATSHSVFISLSRSLEFLR